MNRLRNFLFLFLILLPVVAGAEFPLGVMSFNIRTGGADDGDNSWEYRKQLVAETILRYRPEIAGLQECIALQTDYLAEALPEYHWFGADRSANGGKVHSEAMIVFYRKDVVTPIETGNFWLSETPEIPASTSWDAANVRMVTWARFYHIEQRKMFYYFNTHFDHRGEQARRESARILADRVGRLPADIPVVITGDFNALAEGSVPYEILISAGLTDAWRAAAETKGPELTSSRFGPPAADRTGRIDWILFRGPAQAQLCETVLFNDAGRYPSDHYPVYARLTLYR